MSDVKVHASLELDDHASKVSEHIAHSFEHVHERVAETTHEMGHLLKQAAATALGFQFDRGIHSLVELGEEAIDAAKGLGTQEKAIRGAMAMADRTGKSFEELTEDAHEMREGLEGMAIEMGANTEDLVENFAQIAARSSKTAEEIKEFLGQAINAGKAVPGGLQAISDGFMAIELGVVRARNPVVQMIAQTGLLHGNAKEVAKQMMKMTPESQIQLAEAAVGRMNDKMRNAPQSFAQLIASLHNMRESIFETLGTPMLKSLVPVLGELKGYFVKNREEVAKWAESMGHKVGDWVKEAAKMFRDGFQYLENHADEIRGAISAAMSTVRGTVGWVIDHKEALAIAFGAKSAFGIGEGVMGKLAAGGGAIGIASQAAAVALFVAAVIAWQKAIDQWSKLGQLTSGFKGDAIQDLDARMSRLQEMAANPNKFSEAEFNDFFRLQRALVDTADAAGQSASTMNEYAAALWHQHELNQAVAKSFDQTQQMAALGLDTEASSGWVGLYNEAAKAHNAGLMQYAANVLAGSEALFNAFLASKDNVEGGFDQLGDLVAKKSEEFGKILKSMAGGSVDGHKALNPLIQFNGGQVFHIKQDFRDQDPDRVALVFRRDLVRQAMNRRVARIGTPFGV